MEGLTSIISHGSVSPHRSPAYSLPRVPTVLNSPQATHLETSCSTPQQRIMMRILWTMFATATAATTVNGKLTLQPGDALMVIDVQNDFMAESPLTNAIGQPTYPIPNDQVTSNGKSIRAGSLAVADTFEIVQDINNLVATFDAKQLPVFFSLDWHPSSHCSFAFNGTAESNPGFFNPKGKVAGPLKEGETNEQNYPGIKMLCQDKRTQQDWHNPKVGAMQWPQHCVESTFGARFSPFLRVPKRATVIKKGFNQQLDAYSAFGGTQSVQGYPFDTQDTIKQLESRPSLEHLLQQQKVSRLFLVGIATDFCVKSTAVDGKQLGFLKEVTVILPLTRWVSEPTKQAALEEMKRNGVSIMESKPVVTAGGHSKQSEQQNDHQNPQKQDARC